MASFANCLFVVLSIICNNKRGHPDFTKVTSAEAKKIEEAEQSGFVAEDDIDWDNLEKYA